MKSRPYDRDWKGTSWKDAELSTLQAGASLTFREKLQWLEEAGRLAEVLRKARVRYPDPENPGEWIVQEGGVP